MIVSVHHLAGGAGTAARSEVHREEGTLFIEYYDTTGSLIKREPGPADEASAKALAEGWATRLQTLLG